METKLKEMFAKNSREQQYLRIITEAIDPEMQFQSVEDVRSFLTNELESLKK